MSVPCDEYVVVKKVCHNDERGKELTRIFIDFLRFSIKIKEGEGATRASQSRNLSRQYYLVASKGDDVTQDADFQMRKIRSHGSIFKTCI